MTQLIRSRPGRLSTLVALAGWAAFLSLESWFRPGGFSTENGLPGSLVRGGVVWERQAAAVATGKFPDGVVMLEGADYRPPASAGGIGSPSQPIQLRRLSLSSSGTGVSFPVEAIGPALLGSAGRGRCVVLNGSGSILRELDTAAAWQAWIHTQRPDRAGMLAWLGGLRPYRANTCLWESLP